MQEKYRSFKFNRSRAVCKEEFVGKCAARLIFSRLRLRNARAGAAGPPRSMPANAPPLFRKNTCFLQALMLL
jgi:hypothetical protein